jgi:hypothetical protein
MNASIRASSSISISKSSAESTASPGDILVRLRSGSRAAHGTHIARGARIRRSGLRLQRLRRARTIPAAVGDAEFLAPADGAYWIVVPVGPSGVGFLGDAGKFVSNGRNRVDRMRDTGELTARIVLSAGKSRLRLQGFSRARPEIRAARARVENLIYDSRTGLFQFDLLAKSGTSPEVALSAP